jgi:hypothetical protein
MKQIIGAGLLVTLSVAVSGCSLLTAGSILQDAKTGALAGIAPTLTDDQIVMGHAETHNLRIRLEQIDATPGLVSVQTGGSVIVTGTPMTPPAPTLMPPTGPVVSPAPPGTVGTPTPPVATPGGPTVTPNARLR